MVNLRGAYLIAADLRGSDLSDTIAQVYYDGSLPQNDRLPSCAIGHLA
ncbi:pentapeptide repeat-containing protein [Paenibacillus sp. MWE-103]|uniref:Pentapeptide repeat-containing protein n=1 Tax=Paenibacillus artemisiicola TaxID=1172618 RepID=A0ABS3W473_9BACL|nr:pentapeptide repeat-containing protein [Paenibacillus artemisiicola]